MGYTPPGAELVVRERLTPSLMTIEFARALSARAEAQGASVPVHVKVDTGMSRYGLMPEEVVEFLRLLAPLPGIQLEGLFTHFATADWADLTHARRQLRVFDQVRQSARAAVSTSRWSMPPTAQRRWFCPKRTSTPFARG
jgi:alanine racemase